MVGSVSLKKGPQVIGLRKGWAICLKELASFWSGIFWFYRRGGQRMGSVATSFWMLQEYTCFILRVFPRNEKFKSANLPPDWWSPELFLGWPALLLQKLGVSGTSTKKKKKKEKKNACAVLLVERFQMNLETLLVSGLLINAVVGTSFSTSHSVYNIL